VSNLIVCAAGEQATKDPALGLVLILGVGIVFLGLVSIILICKLMSMVTIMLTNSNEAAESKPTAPTAPVAAAKASTQIENKQEIIAAVSAVVAEELGTDISAIRILSFKKL